MQWTPTLAGYQPSKLDCKGSIPFYCTSHRVLGLPKGKTQEDGFDSHQHRLDATSDAIKI